MNGTELNKLRAVLPEGMEIQEHGPDAPCIYDRAQEDVYPLKDEPTAASALQYLLSTYASAGRKRGKEDALKPLRDALGLTHSLNDVHARIGELNTRLIMLEKMHEPVPVDEPHM